MTNSRDELYKDDVVPSLWKRYQSSFEFKSEKRIEAISSVHPLVKVAEQAGLERLIKIFLGELQNMPNIRADYETRDRSVWLSEWLNMHSTLFKLVLKNRGSFRQLGHDVRFGSPGDEDRHGIPKGGPETMLAIYEYAENIGVQLQYVDKQNIDNVCAFLARVHYGFIRIHPFGDGNGRIARAITDQLAVSLGYPPIIAGFPRLNFYKKQQYHKAIDGCVGDQSCRSLAMWIKIQISERNVDIA